MPWRRLRSPRNNNRLVAKPPPKLRSGKPVSRSRNHPVPTSPVNNSVPTSPVKVMTSPAKM